MDKEAKSMRAEALKMSWHMRGGLTYDQALQLSAVERSIIVDIVKDHMDTTKKSGLPYF